MKSPTTMRIYGYYLEFLNLVGVFPFDLTFNSKTNTCENVSYHKSGKFYWLNKAVVTIFTCYTLLSLYSVKSCIFDECGIYHDGLAVTIGLWSVTLIATLIPLLMFNLQKSRICNFINDWHRVEQAVFGSKFILSFLYFIPLSKPVPKL